MSVSEFINNLIDLALVPFSDAVLFLYVAAFLCVGQFFRIVYRLMRL